MTGEQIAGIAIILFCCWGCGVLFYSIGIWATRRKEPMHFWAGTELDPKSISDIPAYNRENGRMWKLYSVPYWLSGAFGFLDAFESWLSVGCLVMLLLCCTVGIGWLIYTYKRIEKKYRICS